MVILGVNIATSKAGRATSRCRLRQSSKNATPSKANFRRTCSRLSGLRLSQLKTSQRNISVFFLWIAVALVLQRPQRRDDSLPGFRRLDDRI